MSAARLRSGCVTAGVTPRSLRRPRLDRGEGLRPAGCAGLAPRGGSVGSECAAGATASSSPAVRRVYFS